MKRFLATIIVLFITTASFSQKLDGYKYVVIPYEFSFLKKHDQYRVNSLVRFLFKKEGFEVLYDSEEFPEDLGENRCMALYVDIDEDSNMFTTKTKLLLKNCANKIIFETKFGTSRIKAYEKAHNESIRNAFKDVTSQRYSYKPEKQEVAVTKPKAVVERTVTKVVTAPVKEVEKEVVSDVQETVTIKEVLTVDTAPATNVKSAVLYAQPLENGYQLVDSTPKVIMVLLKTGVNDVYLVQGKDAVVYKKNGTWMLSNVSRTGNQVSVLNVKF
ncbi:hypothetical protein [Kordia jejudonensis]|uniref:hypothetical protein n=1 Tax=Kordia jejudonensis TaxID=1348245 RepID=UPI000629AA37|nr:hypothetical protein [Kordia jejudonensis]